MTFTEDWFCQQSQDALARLVTIATKLDGAIIEIGAWEGRSTIAMANAAYPREIHSVDTWEGSPGEESEILANGRDVQSTWCENIRLETNGNVIPHVMGWRQWAEDWCEPIALLFIDAEHTYVEVKDCLDTLLPFVVPGGIVCGDDAHHLPVQRAVLDTVGEDNAYVQATLWIWQKPPERDYSLQKTYDYLCAEDSDIHEHLPRFVELVEARQAQHVIELGSRSGRSTVAWLYGLQQTGGRLTSVDLDPAPDIGEHANWTHIQGDDMDDAIYDAIDPCDILFIDTSHHYLHTLAELRKWSYKVRPGGLILLHDTELIAPEGMPENDPLFPVKQAALRFMAERNWHWTNLENCWGLGIIKAGSS